MSPPSQRKKPLAGGRGLAVITAAKGLPLTDTQKRDLMDVALDANISPREARVNPQDAALRALHVHLDWIAWAVLEHGGWLEHPEMDDLLQEARIYLVPAALDWRGNGALTAYVYQRVRWDLRTATRRLGNISVHLETLDPCSEEQEMAASFEGPDAFVPTKLDLEAAMATLTENERSILEDRFWVGLSISDIARVRDIRRNNVDKAYARALKKLRSALGDLDNVFPFPVDEEPRDEEAAA